MAFGNYKSGKDIKCYPDMKMSVSVVQTVNRRSVRPVKISAKAASKSAQGAEEDPQATSCEAQAPGSAPIQQNSLVIICSCIQNCDLNGSLNKH